jgi:hypothetical protein
MADKILSDPSRRRLFEKDDIYSLLNVVPKQQLLSTRESHSSDEEEGQLTPKPVQAR